MLTFFSQFSLAVLPQSVRDQLAKLYETWTASIADKRLTVNELLDLSQVFVEAAMSIVSVLRDDAVKKQVVLALAAAVFDVAAPFIKTTSWFAWIFWLLGDDSLKQRFLAMVSLLVETLYHAKFAKVAA